MRICSKCICLAHMLQMYFHIHMPQMFQIYFFLRIYFKCIFCLYNGLRPLCHQNIMCMIEIFSAFIISNSSTSWPSKLITAVYPRWALSPHRLCWRENSRVNFWHFHFSPSTTFPPPLSTLCQIATKKLFNRFPPPSQNTISDVCMYVVLQGLTMLIII